MTGGCQCGAIRYEIASLPLLLYTCNCTDCQRQSGSAFALNMPVKFSDFRILQGEPKGWRHNSPGRSTTHHGWYRSRISLCAASSRGCNQRPCGMFRNPAERLGKSGASMACPLERRPRLIAARALFIVPSPPAGYAAVHGSRKFRFDGTV
jgi:glutathione-dependent formaldehyde-activating enzyme